MKNKIVTNMDYFFISFFITCVSVQSVHSVYRIAENVRRTHLASPDPATSVSCFSDYIEKSNEISEAYGQNYKQCLLDAKTGRHVTETEMFHKRTSVEENSLDICKRLTTCNGMDTTLAVFQCHAGIGANNTKDVYDISGNASEYANELQEKYRVIDMRHESCCKSAERNYVEDTGINYRNLQNCLDGRTQPSTTTAIATTTLAAVTSTAAAVKTLGETSDKTTSEASELIGVTLLPGTERFAKLSKLFQ